MSLSKLPAPVGGVCTPLAWPSVVLSTTLKFKGCSKVDTELYDSVRSAASKVSAPSTTHW